MHGPNSSPIKVETVINRFLHQLVCLALIFCKKALNLIRKRVKVRFKIRVGLRLWLWIWFVVRVRVRASNLLLFYK